MFYIDADRNFTVYSAGKQGTISLAHSIVFYLDNIKQTYDSTLLYPTSYMLFFNKPVYKIEHSDYLRYRDNNKNMTHYVIVRDPINRIASGLAQNMYIMQKMLHSHTEPFTEKYITEKFDNIYSFDYYHTGQYLKLLDREILQDSKIINVQELTFFIKKFFKNAPNNQLHQSDDNNIDIENTLYEKLKMIYNNSNVSKLLKSYFNDNMRRLGGTKFNTMLTDEIELYNEFKKRET